MSPRKRSSRSSRSRTELPGTIGLYLHLPFCVSKCAYCDFASLPLESAGGLPMARRYLDALGVELDLRAASPEFADAAVETIYLGGGTPTVLPADWLSGLLERVRRRFAVAEEVEVTVEANPGTVDEAKLAALVAAGVNRLSLGVQSFSDQVLRTLGRAHTAGDAEAAPAAARAAGFANLSFDLIHGVPGQSSRDWEETLQRALAAGPEHISCYGLSIEQGTPLAAGIEAGRLALAGEDQCADMYQSAVALLTAKGYHHYELSNFALPEQECRHNRRYWAGGEYLGVGVSAHSYRGGVRWNNTGSLPVYTEWLERGRLPAVRAELLSRRERVGEMLVLGLRCREGVAEQEIAEACGLSPREIFGKEIEELSDRGLLIAGDGRLRVPRRKWLVSNEVLSHFVA